MKSELEVKHCRNRQPVTTGLILVSSWAKRTEVCDGNRTMQKGSKELDDNSPSKNDRKDLVIAGLVVMDCVFIHICRQVYMQNCGMRQTGLKPEEQTRAKNRPGAGGLQCISRNIRGFIHA